MNPGTVVLDHTALAALAAGNRFLSYIYDTTHHSPDRRILVPTSCLTQSERDRPGSADYFASLEALTFLDLDLAAASAVGRATLPWPHAHAAHAASPNVDWPHGLPLLTGDGTTYQDLPIRTFPLQPPA
ncbi:hypothetical protein GXW83_24485 [Streptacidiphilus sp. PB12-B1b]|uniref:hypothetical protein n=1 Tax=Streptacidiphilus sp. PB12-B1b TaxID=2705012 RepID=UPI0015FAF644|nr:hypothetical protein [Streptacidiphilus sp. PB12-B1b]QMU78396.1 hypothetical protein GXW83_24485 [Streptacidiphilus sp. PB12-B1b]